MKTLLAGSALLLCSFLCANSKDIKSFELKEKKQTDAFDFTGDYPQLEKIEIDGTRKYRAELLLNGHYPKLETVRYMSSFGDFKADLSGHFESLNQVQITAGSTKMVVDLSGSFHKNCDIHIKGRAADITIILPQNIGISVHSKLGIKGKIEVGNTLQKKGRGWFDKYYETAHPEKKLKLFIEGDESRVVLKEKHYS